MAAARPGAGAAAEAFRALVQVRRSARAFQREDAAGLAAAKAAACEALALAQRSPSGWNLQPYRAVLVQDSHVKGQLAHAMVGGNIRRVLEAPVTVVWLADVKPWRLIEDAVRLERQNGAMSEIQLAALASDARFMLGGFGGDHSDLPSSSVAQQPKPGSSNVVGEFLKHRGPDFSAAEGAANAVEQSLKRSLLSLLSEVTQAPTINASAEAWAFKNTMLAVQSYLLGMEALGFQSCPMEGFDARRAMKAISAPASRFSVPIVTSSGVAADVKPGEAEYESSQSLRPRFDFEDVFCQDSFDFPLVRQDRDAAD